MRELQEMRSLTDLHLRGVLFQVVHGGQTGLKAVGESVHCEQRFALAIVDLAPRGCGHDGRFAWEGQQAESRVAVEDARAVIAEIQTGLRAIAEKLNHNDYLLV